MYFIYCVVKIINIKRVYSSRVHSRSVCVSHRGRGRHRDPGRRFLEHRPTQLPAGANVPGESGGSLWYRHWQDQSGWVTDSCGLIFNTLLWKSCDELYHPLFFPGLAQYSGDPRIEWHLNSFSTKDAVLDAVRNLPYKGGNTLTGIWLRWLLHSLWSYFLFFHHSCSVKKIELSL